MEEQYKNLYHLLMNVELTPEQKLQQYKVVWKQIKQLYRSIEERYGKKECN